MSVRLRSSGLSLGSFEGLQLTPRLLALFGPPVYEAAVMPHDFGGCVHTRCLSGPLLDLCRDRPPLVVVRVVTLLRAAASRASSGDRSRVSPAPPGGGDMRHCQARFSVTQGFQ